MGIHGMIDRVSISAGSMFAAKYFRENLEAHSLPEHLENITLNLPAIKGEGDYEVQAETLIGPLEALFRIAQWRGPSYPTIIYHHGAAETPFDFGFNKIFPINKMEIEANLILIRAPFHESSKNFTRGRATADGFLAMIATSIILIDKLALNIKNKSNCQIIISGSSLGGFITNFHHIYFDSADIYVPLLAGLNFYDALFESIYSKAVAKTETAQREKFKDLFDFTEEFADCNNNNVFPLLASEDQIVRYEVQKESYGDCPVFSFKKGHATGALAAKVLREHILSTLEK